MMIPVCNGRFDAIQYMANECHARGIDPLKPNSKRMKELENEIKSINKSLKPERRFIKK